MPQTDSWTVGRLLEWTTDFLKKRGAESPRLDAELLLAEAMGCQRIMLYTAFGQEPAEPQRTTFRELVRRRGEGTPVAYLLGRREFYSMEFRVTSDVLIPRPETELLVVALLDHAKESGVDEPTVCDVGTGSGVLAVCAAKYLPRARVTALDVSPEALEVARSNAQSHGVADRVEFVRSDLLAEIPAEPRFDFIVSNPPYVTDAEWDALPRDIREHEPRRALAAGPNGTEVIERLIPQAAEHLQPGGHLLMEISPMIHDRVQALLRDSAAFEPGETVLDGARLKRVVQAQRVS